MNPKTLLLASATLFAFGLGSATAGPCTTEIDKLTKVLVGKDAGSGPSAGASGGAPATLPPSDQHPPTAVIGRAAQGVATSAEDVRRQTAGQPTTTEQAAGGAGQHAPTAAMSQATQSQRAPETAGQHPPTAVMSEATRTQAAPAPSASSNTSEASLALTRARLLDQQGKEAECMEAVREARLLAGSTLVQAEAQQSQSQQGQPSQALDQLRSDQSPGQQRGPNREDIVARMDAHLARAKEALHLSPEQEKNWPNFQAALRDLLNLYADRIADRRDQTPVNAVERLRRNADRFDALADALKRLADAGEPLYNSLGDGQKERFGRLARMARRHLASLVWQRRARDRSWNREDHRYGSWGGYSRDDNEDWRSERGRMWRDDMEEHEGGRGMRRHMRDKDESPQSRSGDRSYYRYDREQPRGGYGRSDDEDWRGYHGRRWRDRMLDDEDEDWRSMRRGRMIYDGDYDDHHERMHRKYDRCPYWRSRHRDRWCERRYHARGAFDGWRSDDCPDRD